MIEDYYERLIRSINKNDLSKILKLMGSKGITVPGFNRIEKIPTQILINAVNKKEIIRKIYLESAKEIISEQNDSSELLAIIEHLQSKSDDVTLGSLFEKFENSYQSNNFDKVEYGRENKSKEKDNMYIYLGYMDYYDSRDYRKIYYFYPMYEKIGESFAKIDDPKERFKDYGNFAIFLEEKDYPIDEQFKKGEYCIIELNEEDILDNMNYDGSFKSSHRKIYIDKLDRAGKIHKLSDYNLYPIVEASSFNLNLVKSGPIELNDLFPINRFSTKVLLNYSGYYYGPFDATYRSQDGKMVLLNNIDKCRYVCNRYSITKNDEEVLIYCDPQNYSVERIEILPISSPNVDEECKDFLDDKELLSDYNNYLKDYSDIEEGGKQYFASIPNESVAEKRFERLKVILSKQDNFASYQSQLSDLMVSFVVDNSDEKNIKKVLEELSDDQTFLNKIQNVRVIKDRIEKLTSELEQLETQKNSFKQEKLDEIAEEIKNKEDEKARLIKEIDNFDECLKKLRLAQDIDKIKSEYDAALQSWGRIESQIDTKIKEVKDSAAQIIFNDQFDKMVYQKMTDAISKFENDNEEEKYKKATEEIEKQYTETKVDEDLINYIVSEVKKYRPGYERNTIVNILICISQGLLTVFSGKPGTGKTSICKIISHVLGLDNPLGIKDGLGRRFTNIHVERGWNSKRDLIGYYNPLSRKIEKNNVDMYNTFRILDTEVKNGASKLPAFVLLDEANLSPMEFYWADFVGMCDDFLFGNNTINLGDNVTLSIPKTLRFLATINNDHTTETISPRLIDRAFVITLSNQSTNEDNDDFKDDFHNPVEYENLYNSISNDDGMTNEQLDIYKYFEKKFKDLHLDLSPRVKKSVEKYCSSANNLFLNKDSIDKTIIAIDYALSQRVITKIQGGNQQYTDVLHDLSDYCGKKNLLLTKSHLDRIIDNGKEEEYYQFFD